MSAIIANGPAFFDVSCCQLLRSLTMSVKAEALDWMAIWRIVGTISPQSNVELEDITLRLRKKDDFVRDNV